jgi:F-type H+-transporting ATPase subunit delta
MLNTKIARRWAQGLLEHTISVGLDPATVASELSSFAQIVAGNREWEVFINNPSIPSSVRQEALEKVIGSGNLSEDLRRFLLLMSAKKRFHLLAKVAEFHSIMADRHKGLQPATIVSTRDLDRDEVAAVAASLERHLGIRIKPATVVDPGLLGGFVARVGSLQFDGSVKGQLRRFVAGQTRR